jgi:hypothetical protein
MSPIYAEAVKPLAYPDIGILSDEYSDHIRATTSLLAIKSSRSVGNWQNDYCKTYMETVTIGELKSILVFEHKDLTIMTPEKEQEYDENSVYFESCNHLKRGSVVGYLFQAFLDFDFIWRASEYLEWNKTDAYIDTEYSLLLIQFLGDEDSFTGSNEQRVKALNIKKRHQFRSNREKPKSLLINHYL